MIAEMCHKSAGGTAKAINRLILRGHVDKVPVGRGKRAAYRLTAAVFRAETVQPAVKAQKRKRREVKIEPCLKCGKACKRSAADGWCRRCLNDSRVRGIVRQEIRRMDREVVEETA